MIDWSRYAPYFSEQEFRCKHTGLCRMNPDFMDALLKIRLAHGKPWPITSGYRDKTHPIEARKIGTGEHAMGHAVDIGLRGGDALQLVQIALAHGIKRIGVQQKGDARFIHLGWGGPDLASPTIWSYP